MHAVKSLLQLMSLPVMVILCLGSASGQTLEAGGIAPLHGTVNVILGNKNGIVVTTDSRLTYKNGRVAEDEAQKLFRIDPNTVCAMAGAYSFPGPTAERQPGYILEETANVINILSEHGEDYWGAKTFETKVDSIASAVLFTLNIVSQIQRLSDLPSSDEPVILTVATNKGSHLQFANVELKPIFEHEKLIRYEKGELYSIPIDEFRYWIAGQQQAEPILRDPISYPDQQLISDNPILGKYKTSYLNRSRESLSIADLKELGTELERFTATKSKVVGGRIQIAILEPNNLTFIQTVPYRSTKTNHIVGSFGELNTKDNFRDAIHVSGSQKVFVQGGEMTNGHQAIDNIFFFNFTVDHSTLFYGGSTVFGLDRSNIIKDSVLILGSNVDSNSTVVRQIRADFPSLKIMNLQDYHSKDPYWPPDPQWSPR